MTLIGKRRLSAATGQALARAGLDPEDVVRVIERGLAEDLGVIGDLTSVATVAADAVMSAGYVAREAGTVAGLPVLAAVVEWATGTSVTLLVADGDRVQPGDVLAEVTAAARTVLALERLSLNLLGHLSGIATATRAWADAVAATPARIRDTRKTTPGLRDLEKYAVRCGGGVNHRRGLDDAVLIKDNHVAAVGGVGAALDRVQALYRGQNIVIQVEVDDEDQLEQALRHGAAQVLLDNFTVDELTRAVTRIRTHGSPVLVEASGGLTLDRAAQVAQTGVDFLAVGALTHSARSLDIGLDAR
jgi:nicotinate-nucleotide pyrophosphorylase (carboxylating)